MTYDGVGLVVGVVDDLGLAHGGQRALHRHGHEEQRGDNDQQGRDDVRPPPAPLKNHLQSNGASGGHV